MDQVLTAVAVTSVTMTGGGAAWLRHLLRRDVTWKPDAPLPQVPPDAPILHWKDGTR